MEEVTTATGLKYKDIIKGKGPTPEPGFQARQQRTCASLRSISVQLSKPVPGTPDCKYALTLPKPHTLSPPGAYYSRGTRCVADCGELRCYDN